MIRRSVPPLAAGVGFALLFAMAAPSASGKDPFRITPLKSENLKADGPIGSLYTPGDSDTLHAGTYGDAMADFTFYLPDAFNNGTSLPRAGKAGLATLMLGGTGREFFVGGLGRVPELVILPGTGTGPVPVPDQGQGKILGIAVEPAGRLVALRCEQKVLVYRQVPDASQPVVIDGSFDRLALVRDAQTTWLAGAADQDGTIQFWRVSDPKDVHVVRLPPGRPLTCFADRNGGGMLATGDAAGRLRSWKAGAVSTRKAIQAGADAFALSPKGDAMALHFDKKIAYMHPFGGAPAKPVDAEAQAPTSIRADADGLVAVAWPKGTAAFGVDLFSFAAPQAPKRTNLVAQVTPTGPLRAVAFRGGAAPQAAAFDSGSKRVILFFPMQPPVPPNNQGEDDAIVGLSYLPDADGRIIAIGQGLSLYRADTGKLAKKVVHFKLKAADVVSACDVGPVGSDGSVRVLLGTQGGRLELWKASLNASPPVLDRLALSDATGQSLDRVALGQGRALSASGGKAILWDLGASPSGDSPIVPLEAFQEAEDMRAIALGGDDPVIYCTPSRAVQSEVSALQRVACGDQPITSLVADDASTVFIAADASGTLYRSTLAGPQPADKLSGSPQSAITALALHPAGKTLLVAFQKGGKPILHHRGVDSGDNPSTYEGARSPITSLAFGADDATVYLGEKEGRLKRLVAAKSGAALLTQDLRLADAKGGNVALAWRPEPDPTRRDLLLVVEDQGQLSLRVVGTTAIPRVGLAAGPIDTSTPAPWYAPAPSPDGRSIALVNAEGQAWLADWAFPLKVKDWSPDVPVEVLLRAPAAGQPQTKALYAAAWLGEGNASTLAVAGAGGNVLFASNAGWVEQAPPSPSRPIYAMEAHRKSGRLVIGFGPSVGTADASTDWLLVQADPLHSPSGTSWGGHAGPIAALGFSPGDQTILASADATGRLKLWDLNNIAGAGPPPASTTELAPGIPTSLAWLEPDVLAVGLQGGRVALFRVEPNP